MQEPTTVHVRPRKTRLATFAGAAFCVVAGVVLSLAMSGSVTGGPELFGPADRVATIGLGLLGAAIVLTLGRPLVVADAEGIRVRNILGGAYLPWNVVRAIKFEHGATCAALELHDDDELPVQAVQAVDKQRAVDAIRQLRRLHAEHAAREQRQQSDSRG